MSLVGQNVLNTGASMGIGVAIALKLAGHGANLILFARSEDKPADLSKQLHEIAGEKIKVFAQ